MSSSDNQQFSGTISLDDSPEAVQKLILARGIFEQKERIFVMTILAVLIMLALIIFSDWTHELNYIDALLNAGLSLGYCVGMLLMMRMSDEKLYNALFKWVIITLIVLCALLYNELHGERRALAADNSYPYVVAYIPMEVLFIHAFLVPKVAWKVTIAYILACAAIVLVPPLFTDGVVMWSSGTIWTLICVTMVSLLAAVLAHLNQTNHSEVMRAVTLEKQRLEEEIQLLERAEFTDELTGGMNELGIRRRLRADLAEYPGQLVGMLQVYQEDPEMTDVDSRTLQRIAFHVEKLLGENTRWGRMHEKLFVVWSPGISQEELQARLDSMPTAFAGEESIIYSITGLQGSQAQTLPNPEFDLLVEAENRLFINSMKTVG